MFGAVLALKNVAGEARCQVASGLGLSGNMVYPWGVLVDVGKPMEIPSGKLT